DQGEALERPRGGARRATKGGHGVRARILLEAELTSGHERALHGHHRAVTARRARRRLKSAACSWMACANDSACRPSGRPVRAARSPGAVARSTELLLPGARRSLKPAARPGQIMATLDSAS